MNYPTGFPYHLEPPVDEAIATAEIAFSKAKSKVGFWRAYDAEPLIFAFVKPVFFAFAHQMCRAVEERCQGWNQERVRRELDNWLRLLIVDTWRDKHPHPDNMSHRFHEDAVEKIRDSEEWRTLHQELKRVAIFLQGKSAAPTDDPKSRSSVEANDETVRRMNLLAAYKLATHNPSNRSIYTARNSGIHKPEFYDWINGVLHNDSETCKNFERFLREKKPPIPRHPKE